MATEYCKTYKIAPRFANLFSIVVSQERIRGQERPQSDCKAGEPAFWLLN